MLNQDQKPDQLANAVTAALHLAASLDTGGNVGRLELDLTWDISPAWAHLPPLACPETLLLPDQTSKPETMEWKLSLDFETMEAIVDREIGKKTPQGMGCTTDSVLPPEARETDGEAELHVPAMENLGSFPAKKILKDKQILVNLTTTSAVPSAESTSDINIPKSSQPGASATAGSVPCLGPRFLVQNPMRKEAAKVSYTAAEENSHLPQKDLDVLHTPAVSQAMARSDSSVSAWQRVCPGTGSEGCEAGHQQAMAEDLMEKVQETGPGSKDPALDGFDLQFDDDEDLMLGSDSFDEDNSAGRMNIIT